MIDLIRDNHKTQFKLPFSALKEVILVKKYSVKNTREDEFHNVTAVLVLTYRMGTRL